MSPSSFLFRLRCDPAPPVETVVGFEPARRSAGGLGDVDDARTLYEHFLEETDAEADDASNRNHKALELGNTEVRRTTMRTSRAYFAGWVLAVMAATLVLLLTFSPSEQSAYWFTAPVVSKHGAVTSGNAECARMGRDVMDKMGGNAMDAAVTVGMCLGVLHSFYTGVGGGGFMTVRLPNGTAKVINFRERAPRAANLTMYAMDSRLAQVGGLAVGVPGEVMGYWEAHSRHGRLPWKDVVEVAAKTADEGFALTKGIMYWLKLTEPFILADQKGFGAIYAPDGVLLKEGDMTSRKNYAATLRRIAAEGPPAIYDSDMTEHIVDFINSRGGNISVIDFAEYFANVEEPLVGYYHGARVITARPPACGAVLLAALNILEGFNLSEEGPTPLAMHRIVEAWKFAYAYRTNLGDPGRDGEFIPDFDGILDLATDKSWGDAARMRIDDDRTHDPPYYNPKFASKEMPGTTAFSIIDGDDMAVAVTGTVNLIFGARIMDPVTGIIFNNQMDDFSWPSHVNNGSQTGMPPSPANFIHPGKRPLSASTPTIVEKDGRTFAALAASGGSKITTGVSFVLHNILDFHMNPQAATDLPRFHHQLFPNQVSVEDDLPIELVESFMERGHKIGYSASHYHLSVTEPLAVVAGAKGRMVAAGTDPRSPDGGAFGY